MGTVTRPNPYTATRPFCIGREEDHLTEFWAAALDACPAFREAYARFLLAEPAKRRPGWEDLAILAVRTQVAFQDNIPDLLLLLGGRDGRRLQVAVEHKIFAKESRRTRAVSAKEDATSEEEVVGQLARYLAIPGIDGVAYVRI